MKYLVLEIMINNDDSVKNQVSTFDTLNKAKHYYHLLSTDITDEDLAEKTVVLMTSNGKLLAKKGVEPQ